MPRLGCLAFIALFASACGTGPDDLAIAGTWQGTALLPASVTTSLTLTQAGNTIGGTIQISGFLDRALIGTLDESARTIEWLVFAGCEEWNGTFTITSDGSEMSGPVQGDFSNCSLGNDVSGTISVSKQ
jgi:hypothetical protein